jgi:4-amino-4-deoxychorismate lyase
LLPTLDLPRHGEFKLRLTYGATLIRWEAVPYTIRPVRSLAALEADDLRYAYKYADRTALHSLFGQRGEQDDILIVQRGYLTDTSYANLALYDGRQWYTPAWPLLRGVRRDYLLEKGVIKPALIRLRDLQYFSQLRLINAMMDWEDGPSIPTSAIRLP